MGPIDFIIIGAIILVIGGAIAYIVVKKKSGVRCIGCPWAEECGKRPAENGCACGRDEDKE